jgi:F-type H+-transporting ATPase subunit a
MKNVSLSLRLYGNIYGGHQAVVAMNDLGMHVFKPLGFDSGIPFGEFLLPIKLLTCLVQAMIFCLLFCVYLSLVTHHEHHEEAVTH